MNRWSVLASAVLAVHLTFIIWVIFGWRAVRDRPVLRWLHFGSLIYGIFIELAPWPCPLTLLEQWLETRGGIPAYRQPFLVHYLDLTVYPNLPASLLITSAVVVCGFNLWLHLRRLISH